MEKQEENKRQEKGSKIVILLVVLLSIIIALNYVSAVVPSGPDNIVVSSNTTKNATAPFNVNISGGYLAKLNISATVQNSRWKAFVGWVNGLFTLKDGTGSKIYDWSTATTG
jgi:hypothetical protein